MNIVMLYFFYCILGLVAGLCSGLFGIGGGVIIVPILSFIFVHFYGSQEWIMPLATGTSLAAMSMITLISSVTHYKLGQLNQSVVFKMMPGMILGVMTGVLISDYLSTSYMQIIFSIFLVCMALNLWFKKAKKMSLELAILLPSNVRLYLVTYFIGTLAGVLGIGGGLLLMPFLLFLRMPFSQAAATTVACVFPAMLVGAITAGMVGSNAVGLPMYATGFVYWPAVICIGLTAILGAPLGAYLSHRLPVIILKRLFAIILLFMAWQMSVG